MEYEARKPRRMARRWGPRNAAFALEGLAGACQVAQAETTFTVGATVGAAPRYVGSNGCQVLGAPKLRADFGKSKNGVFGMTSITYTF